MARYNVRYVHRISPKPTDTGACYLLAGAFSDSRSLAKALRSEGVLQPGERLREMRVEGDRVLCFPDRGVWHCIVLEQADAALPTFATMTDDELMSFWSRYHRASRKDAEALIGDRRPMFTSIASTLANYACNLATAKGCARRGDVDGEALYNQHASMCLERLPADIRANVRGVE